MFIHLDKYIVVNTVFTDIQIAMVNIKMHTLFAEIHASLRNYIFAGVRKLWSNIIFFHFKRCV